MVRSIRWTDLIMIGLKGEVRACVDEDVDDATNRAMGDFRLRRDPAAMDSFNGCGEDWLPVSVYLQRHTTIKLPGSYRMG